MGSCEKKEGKRVIGWLERTKGFFSALPVTPWVKGKCVGIKIDLKKIFKI